MPERVTFSTVDQVPIVGLYQRTEQKKFAVLLHMMPATKESWASWQTKLAAAGYGSLAIDERGHGESTNGGMLDYRSFTDAEQQAKILDVNAALQFLTGQGAAESNTVVIGASVGANLAIEFLQQHPNVKTAVALSPGLNFRGILTEPLIQNLSAGQHVILVASDDDPQQTLEAAERLHALNPDQTTVLSEHGLGHGTAMTDADPDLIDQLIKLLP